MGVIDWLKQGVSTAIKYGKKAGAGISWLHQNVLKPGAEIARQIPLTADVVQKAGPLIDFAGKAGGALEGKNGISVSDFKSAADAIPGTMKAGRQAGEQIRSAFGKRVRV